MTRARCATAQTKSRSSVTRQSRSETLNMRNLIYPVSIMIPALHDLEPLLPTLTGNAIHQPVLAENAAGAPALQGMLQRLRRAEAFERNALDVADQFVDPRAHPLVRLLPVQIVVPASFGPCRLHAAFSAASPRRPSRIRSTCPGLHRRSSATGVRRWQGCSAGAPFPS